MKKKITLCCVSRVLPWDFQMDFKAFRDLTNTSWIYATVCGEIKHL